MKSLFNLSGFFALIMIFWSALGYLMGLPYFPLVLTVCIISIILFFITGFLKNRSEQRKFQEFLDAHKQDKAVQDKIQNEKLTKGDKTGRAKVKAEYRDRNIGVNWTGASVHGAVPQRKKRRTFLPKNR